MQQVTDRTGAGAVVKNASATADDRLALRAGRIGETDARRKVVGIVVKIILPVVAHSHVQREIWLHANVVFHESAEHFFQKSNVALAGLHEISGWRRGGVVGRAGKSVGAGAVGEIVQPAAADVGDVDAKAELMLAVGVGGEVGPVEVIFGAPRIGLRPARGEESRDGDLGIRIDAGDRELSKCPTRNRAWFSQCGENWCKIADVDLVLQKMRVRLPRWEAWCRRRSDFPTERCS